LIRAGVGSHDASHGVRRLRSWLALVIPYATRYEMTEGPLRNPATYTQLGDGSGGRLGVEPVVALQLLQHACRLEQQ
jgi:hypothetical protein